MRLLEKLIIIGVIYIIVTRGLIVWNKLLEQGTWKGISIIVSVILSVFFHVPVDTAIGIGATGYGLTDIIRKG